MRSKRALLALVAGLAAAFVVFPATASAAGMTNADCMVCHTSVRPQNFTVGPVNRDTACKKCHVDSYVGTHPYHNPTANCGAVCHPGMGASLASAVPSVLTTGGAFATLSSQDTSPALLHVIHANARWEGSAVKGSNDCGRCHAVSACTACHDDAAVPVASVHANHGSTSTTVTPWVGDVSYGLPTGKVTGVVSRCGAPTCHNTAGVAAAKPGLLENYNASAVGDYLATSVSYTGRWATARGAAYSRGQESVGLGTDDRISTTFTGQRVYIVTDRDPYRGIAEIILDGVSQGTVDEYYPITKTQVELWKSGNLSPGSHTISVRVTGDQNPNARAAYVSVDQFKVYTGVPASVAPNCTDACHPDKASGHGSYTWPHEATQTAGNFYNGGTGNYRCDSCHSIVFFTEHNRTSSSSAGKGCGLCHLTYAPQSITGTWVANDGCNYSQCHATATVRQPHTAISASHTASTETTQQPCRDCHAGDLGAIHNNSITTNAYTTNCNTCHTPTKYPASNSCSAQGCHDASGVRLVDDHAINATFIARHTPTTFTLASQSPGPDGAIATGGKECSTCHTARLDVKHATTSIGAVGCTSGGTGNTGCHFNTSLNTMNIAKAGWTTEKCAECHDYGTARTHDTTVTAHSVAAGSCAGTAGCHTSTSLWAIHANRPDGVTAPTYASCNNVACHDAANKDKRPTAKTCGSGNACHNVANPHKPALHTSTRVECTSCHGSTDIQVIHAGVGNGCNVCHGGGGYTDVAAGKTSDCVGCHNASGVGVKKTYSPITTGHYVGTETSHTAGASQSTATLNWGGNPACGACHNMELNPEHARATSSKTTSPTSTCENCHLSTVFTNSATVVAGKWSARTGSSACIACHAVDTATNQHGQIAITGNHNVTGDTQSCASSGAGCHPVSNVSQVGARTTTANIHLACASCHGTASRAGLVVPGALATGCTGNTACHSTGYATNNHNALTGNEAIHTASSASMATTVGAYTYYNACTNCHSTGLALAHTDTSTTALLDTGSTGWNSTAQSSCRDCHNAAATTKTIASAGVVKASWSTKTCAECHTATLHSTLANHSVTAASGCTLSTGCHGYTGSTLDVRSLHDKSTSGCTAKGTDNKGWSGGCHEIDKAMTTTAMSCGSGATGQACHTGHTNTNHGPDHTYTTASDYSESTSDTVGGEAGCSNSGAACHGASGALRDAVTDYHPAGSVSCLSSACHTSSTMTAAWKLGGSGADCSRCHAGNFVNAKNNMPLFQVSSAGHYNETTHTVTGMSTSVSAGGTASAVCSACHSSKLRDAHGAVGGPLLTTTKGSYVTCKECHGYNAAVSAVVTDTVHSNTCSTCHASGVMGSTHAVHATTAPVANVGNGTGCASSGIGCHNTTDLHAIHKDAGSCALAGCHDALNKSLTAASTSCGQSTGCHTSTKYTSAIHNGTHGLINGTDTTHTAGLTQMSDTYTYNGKSAACSACHAAALLTEHSRSTSALTGAGATVCLQCHNDSATVANIVTTGWPNQNTTSGCASCHANTDATSAATAHGNVATHSTGTTVTGCTGLGAGCHGTAAAPDLTTVHTTGCALGRACHSTTVYNPGVKTCTASACHPTTDYNTTTYAHHVTTSNINGTDATHTVTAGMTTTVGAGGTATAACTLCHSTTLKNAHDVTKATASIISTVTGVTSWSNECTGCHNTTAPVNVSTVVAAGTWPHTCMGSNCHTTGQDVHVDGGAADAPVTLGTTTVTPACNNTGCHASMDLHALHKNAVGGCGLTDVNGSGCHNAANIDQLPTQKTCGGTGGANGPCHQGYASGTHGVSSGGKTCDSCHGATSTSRLDKMVNDTTTYHHVLDNATPYQAPNAATYPVDEAAMACVSCHGDHNYFNSNPGANLRTSINAASISVTNTDFIGGNGASGNYDDGICLSCHYASKTKSTTGQLATGSGMSTVTPAISALDYNNSSHNYEYSAQYTKNSSAFRANCSKCHDDETDLTKTFQNGTYKIATHFSAESRIAKALGVTLTSANSEENLCYSCHSGGLTAGTDAYGAAAMSAKSRGIQLEFAKAYAHNVATYAGIHRSDEYNAAPSSVAPATTTGWWGTSNAKRHVECEDCHDPHAAANARTPLSASNVRAADTAVPVSGAEKSVWGVDISGSASGLWTATGTLGTPVQPTYNKIAASAYEWQLCLKCHSRYAWGNTPVTGESANLGGLASTSATMTDVGRDFSTTMYAFHPLFKAGRNQPAATLNANWDSSTNRRLISGSNTGNGISNTLTDGWLSRSIVTCTDCHGSDNAASPEGAHGSSQRWMLKTADPNIVVTIANGLATTPNSGNTETGNYCLNCHRRDVYTNGNEASQASANFSRFTHPANTSCMDRTKSVVGLAGCMNCHGGRKDDGAWTTSQNGQAGAIHGSNLTWYAGSGTTAYAATQAFKTNPMSERFCNGAAWTSHGLGDASGSIGCQTLAGSDSYSTCSAHGTSTKTKTVVPNYYYTYVP